MDRFVIKCREVTIVQPEKTFNFVHVQVEANRQINRANDKTKSNSDKEDVVSYWS